MRPPIRTNCWLCIVTGLAVAASGVCSPIRNTQTPNVRLYPDLLSLNFNLSSHGFGLALTSAKPGRLSIDVDKSDLEEEDEFESFWSFSHLVCTTFIHSHSPPHLLSGPCPGNSPARIAAVPLRC
jgi:hypothetical protein